MTCPRCRAIIIELDEDGAQHCLCGYVLLTAEEQENVRYQLAREAEDGRAPKRAPTWMGMRI